MKRQLLVIALALLALEGSWVSWAVNPSVVGVDQKYELPAPTGSYRVGRKSFYWPDSSRPEELTNDPQDKRELMVHLYYPAEASANAATAPYCIGYDAVKSLLDPVRRQLCQTIKSYSVADAKLSVRQASYPVLIFSHGNEMVSALYAFMIEDLASHGYIVAAIDHPYEAVAIAYPNGRVATFAEEKRPKFGSPDFFKNDFLYYQLKISTRVADSIFVLNQLEKLNVGQFAVDFKGRLDLGKVGILGHSNGGMTAAQACLADARFKAAINLDGVARSMPILVADAAFIAANAVPGLIGGYSEKAPAQPFMAMQKFMPGPSDEQLKKMGGTRENWDKRQAIDRDRLTKLLGSIKGGSYLVVIKGATHSSFSDPPLIVPPEVLARLGERQDQPVPLEGKNTFSQSLEENLHRARLIRVYTLAFFDQHLLGKESALLNGKASADPLVTFERFRP